MNKQIKINNKMISKSFEQAQYSNNFMDRIVIHLLFININRTFKKRS